MHHHQLVAVFFFLLAMIASNAFSRLPMIRPLTAALRNNAMQMSLFGAFSTFSSSAPTPSSTSAPSSSSLRLTTYNVLSSSLAGPGYFTSCKPEYLDQDYRLKKLKAKLEEDMKARSVICLQELSISWTGALHSFFQDNGYYLVTGLYGNKFNGYMGVGIAYPLDKFTLLEADITKIADTKKMPKRKWDKSEKELGFRQKVKKTWESLRQIWGSSNSTSNGNWKKDREREFDLWQEVTRRSNQAVALRLQFKSPSSSSSSSKNQKNSNKNKQFVVGTYHMPCMFDQPSVMVAHCALSAQHFQKFAGGDPLIYAGDFNIKPDSSMYSMLTEGALAVGVSSVW
jgi:mRNA deadenylase 3'-5' endonuclease subunit Ccr4